MLLIRENEERITRLSLFSERLFEPKIESIKNKRSAVLNERGRIQLDSFDSSFMVDHFSELKKEVFNRFEFDFPGNIFQDPRPFFPEFKKGETDFSSDLSQKCEKTPLMLETIKQLNEYFEGKRTRFDIPLEPENATPYRLKVWNALQTIPFGKTRSYREIAEMIGNPLGARSVGNACGANPILILIPCHRVIGSHRKLGGFSSGIELKKELLKWENINL